MFTLKREWGDHKIYSYDVQRHPFVSYFEYLYEEENLETLHLKSKDYHARKEVACMGALNDVDTDLHSKFYTHLKTSDVFKRLYNAFVKDIFSTLFPNEPFMVFQSYPSIRIQFMNSMCVPPHKDSDHLSNHPLGEKNFLIPITEMKNTNSVFIESEPDKKDFKSVNLSPGDVLWFNGNTCTHYNEPSSEPGLRISLDFRVLLMRDYMLAWDSGHRVNPRDLQLRRKPTVYLAGGYYQCFHRDDSLDDMLNWYTTKNIMQHRPAFDKEEAEAVYKYMQEDTFVTEHKKTTELEKMICSYLNCKHCIMTTSGTAAIILGLMALDLSRGDEVIVPNYTMVATVNAVKFLGLTPVIVDVDPETFTLNTSVLTKSVTTRTGAVIHVSLNNRYTDMNDLLAFCECCKLPLLEDSAQSLGCTAPARDGIHQALGTFGKIGCFSLSTPKIISTGQGGFCVTDDDELAVRMRMSKNFGRRESGKDNFETFGINLKFTDIQAVIGIEQMKKLPERVLRYREIYQLYYKNLSELGLMKAPLSDTWIPWFVDVYTDDRDQLALFLRAHSVSTRPTYGEISSSPMYFRDQKFPNSNVASKLGLFLPSYVSITDNDIMHICKLIRFYFAGKVFQ